MMLTAIHPLGSAQLKLLLPLGSESLRRPNERGGTEVTRFWIKTFSGWWTVLRLRYNAQTMCLLFNCFASIAIEL